MLWSARLHRDGRVLECQTLRISAGGARIKIGERFAIKPTVVLVIDRVGAFPGRSGGKRKIMPASVSRRMRRQVEKHPCALLCLNPWTSALRSSWRHGVPRAQTIVPSCALIS